MATKTYKKFLTGAATAAMVASAVAPVAAQGQDVAQTSAFTDVGLDDYFMEITEANELGFVSGYDAGPNAGKFLPYQKISRGHVVKILAKYVLQSKGMTLSEYNAKYDLKSVEKFADLDDNHPDQELVNYSKIVKNEGIFEGSENNLMHEDNIQRQQIASVLVRAFKLQDKEGTPELTDLDEAFDDHAKAVEIFAENGVTDQETFRPKEHANRGQFTAFLMRAYKVSQGVSPEKPLSPIASVDAVNDITINVGETPALPKTVTVTHKNGLKSQASVDWDTTSLNNKKVGTYPLTGDVEGTDLEAKVNVKVVSATAPEANVASVTAVNPTEIQVKFDKAVDAATALNLDNYTLTINNDKFAVANNDKFAVANKGEFDAYSDILLNIDPKAKAADKLTNDSFNPTTNTVTLKLKTALENADKYSVDVTNGVLTADKTAKVDAYKDTVKTFNDTKAPVLESTALNAKGQLVLTFDEPVEKIGLVKVNEVTVYDPNGNRNAAPVYGKTVGDYTVTLKNAVPDNLRAVGSYNVVAYDVVDQATLENTSQVVSGSYTISNDTTAPTVSSVSSAGSRAFDVKFSEPVAWDTFKALVESNNASFVVKKGNYTFTLDKGYTVSQENATTWRVKFATPDADQLNPLYNNNETSASISVEVAGYKDAANNVGNKYAGSVTLNKDLTPPAIKDGLENRIVDNTVVVKLNKAVTTVGSEADLSKIKVTDKNGISRTVQSAKVQNSNELAITLKADTDPVSEKTPVTVTLSAGLLKSAEGVQNKEDSVVIDVDSVISPIVAGVVDAVGNLGNPKNVNGVNVNTITITYDQAMGASATELSNYKLDNKALTGATISMDTSNKIVNITLPEGFAKVDNQQLLEISTDVKTAKGSSIVANETTKAPYTKLVRIKDSTKPVLDSAVFVVTNDADTQTKRIKLTFSENVKLGDDAEVIKDLAVTIGGTEHPIDAVAKADVKTNTLKANEVVITLAQPTAITNTVDVSVVGITSTNQTMDIKDVAGNIAKTGTVTVKGTEKSPVQLPQ